MAVYMADKCQNFTGIGMSLARLSSPEIRDARDPRDIGDLEKSFDAGLSVEQLEAHAAWLAGEQPVIDQIVDAARAARTMPDRCVFRSVDEDSSLLDQYLAAIDKSVSLAAKWLARAKQAVDAPYDYMADPAGGEEAWLIKLDLLVIDAMLDKAIPAPRTGRKGRADAPGVPASLADRRVPPDTAATTDPRHHAWKSSLRHRSRETVEHGRERFGLVQRCTRSEMPYAAVPIRSMPDP
jgi:hypothetical protein